MNSTNERPFITILSASPRKKGCGASLSAKLAESLGDNGGQAEVLYLADYAVKHCLGCLICQKKSGENCPLKDDAAQLFEKFKRADAIVFVSPVYGRMISGNIKQLFDRMSYMLHRPHLSGKLAYLITTASYGGNWESLRYMKLFSLNLALRVNGTLGVLAKAYAVKNDYRGAVDRKLAQAAENLLVSLRDNGNYRPSLRELLIFNKWKRKVQAHQAYYPGDYAYWQDADLLGKDFYYPARINPLARLVIPRVFKRMITVISKRSGYAAGVPGAENNR